MRLLTTHNYKTTKGEARGYLTGVLHLAPHKLSGHNVCPKATAGCSAACLNTSGRGAYDKTQKGRIARTLRLFNDREKFISDLEWDIGALIRKATREDLTPAVRINGTSDLPWLAIKMAERFPSVQLYDYTKIIHTLRKPLPGNYYLTFSKSEDNLDECVEALRLGFNVSIVFRKVPETYLGFPVINGDEDDLRFLDPLGFIVGLSAKGRGKNDKSGFVVDV